MARSKVPHHDPAALPDDVEALYPLAKQPGPRSLLEFQQLFASEAQCAAYLRNIRWPAGFVCPKCGSRTGYTLATRRVTECRNGHPVSLTGRHGPASKQAPTHALVPRRLPRFHSDSGHLCASVPETARYLALRDRIPTLAQTPLGAGSPRP